MSLPTLLFAVALAVRIAVGLWTGIGGPPVEDERGYTLLARSLAAGEGFALPVPEEVAGRAEAQPVAPRTSFRGPALPAVLAAVAAAGGGVTAFRIVNLLIGAAAAPLLFLALRATRLGRFALWPALAYALWPPAVYLSARVLSEPLSQALLLGGVACLLSSSPRLSGRTGAVLGGALAGLAVLARPGTVFAAGALAFGAGSRRRALAYGVAFVAALAPWVIRNAALHGRPLLTTNSGVTLVGGNSAAAAAAAHPGKWAPPEAVYADADEPPDLGMWGWSRLSEDASDRRFTSDAVDWVRANPGAAAGLALHKAVRLFDPDPHSAKADAAGKSLLGWLTLVPVVVLALVGIARGVPARAPWIALIVGTLVGAVVFYGDTRMRTPADPALLAFAAGALVPRTDRNRTPRDAGAG